MNNQNNSDRVDGFKGLIGAAQAAKKKAATKKSTKKAAVPAPAPAPTYNLSTALTTAKSYVSKKVFGDKIPSVPKLSSPTTTNHLAMFKDGTFNKGVYTPNAAVEKDCEIRDKTNVFGNITVDGNTTLRDFTAMTTTIKGDAEVTNLETTGRVKFSKSPIQSGSKIYFVPRGHILGKDSTLPKYKAYHAFDIKFPHPYPEGTRVNVNTALNAISAGTTSNDNGLSVRVYAKDVTNTGFRVVIEKLSQLHDKYLLTNQLTSTYSKKSVAHDLIKKYKIGTSTSTSSVHSYRYKGYTDLRAIFQRFHDKKNDKLHDAACKLYAVGFTWIAVGSQPYNPLDCNKLKDDFEKSYLDYKGSVNTKTRNAGKSMYELAKKAYATTKGVVCRPTKPSESTLNNKVTAHRTKSQKYKVKSGGR